MLSDNNSSRKTKQWAIKKTAFLSLSVKFLHLFSPADFRYLSGCTCVNHSVRRRQQRWLCSSSVVRGKSGREGDIISTPEATELTPPALRQVRRHKQSRAPNEDDCWSQTTTHTGSGRVFRGYVHILSHSLLTVWEVNNFEFSKRDRWKFQQPPGSLNDCVQVHCSLWYYMACITWTGNTWRNMLLCASCIVLVSVGFTWICLCLLCKANCFFSRDIKSDLF